MIWRSRKEYVLKVFISPIPKTVEKKYLQSAKRTKENKNAKSNNNTIYKMYKKGSDRTEFFHNSYDSENTIKNTILSGAPGGSVGRAHYVLAAADPGSIPPVVLCCMSFSLSLPCFLSTLQLSCI